MIYTLTTNPAVDMNFSVNDMTPNKVNRTSDITYTPNGKGVNVSLVLKHFGMNSVVLGFFGGFTGKYIVDELKRGSIDVRPSWIEGDTRINTFISEEGKEYKFVNKGPTVTKEVQMELLDELNNAIDCEILVISGSLPNGVDVSYYDEIFKVCERRGIDVVLDISSPKLKDLLKYKPLLIKPNDEEIKEVFGVELNNEEDIKTILKYLYKEGARNILLTFGDRGLYFYDGKKAYYCDAPKVELKSSACAGDACLATFLSEWASSDDNVEYALKKASSVGGNVAESYGLGTFSNYKDYIKNLNVRGVAL